MPKKVRPKAEPKVGGPNATLADVLEMTMLSRQRIDQLLKDGWITRYGKNQYNLANAVQGYIRFLRDNSRRSQVSAADSRVRDARAKDIEARTAQRLGHLVSISVYDEMIDGFAGLVRSEFAGLSAACTRDLILRRIIEREVNAQLRRMAEYAMAQSVRVAAVRETDAAERPNGAGSVGGSESDIPSDGSGSGAA